jgi:hypothetical protein
MSKLLDQYDEQHEAQAQNEILEVKVVAYTEHGVVVDLGQKTESGLWLLVGGGRVTERVQLGGRGGGAECTEKSEERV